MSVALDAHAGRETPVRGLDAAPLSPNQLENLIECWRLIGTLEPDRDEKVHAFARMRELIAQRTPEVVAKMELDRGLRAP